MGGVGRDDIRVALVHYWLATWGGGEKVLRELVGMFPQADVFAVVASDEIVGKIGANRVRTSFVQKLPGSIRWHRHFLPLYPMALEQFDLRDYDLVISSHSGPAHGVLTSADTCHISYCHSPIRSIWEMHDEYENEMSAVARFVFRPVAHYMRLWEVASASRVDFFAANSFNVAKRIAKTYRRDATVIYPPVELARDRVAKSAGDYYLVVGRLVGYKRVDLAIEACKRTGRALHVVGGGPQLAALRRAAGHSKIEFVTNASDEQLAAEYANCRALLFPAEDDFGMVPVEAQGYGRPVIAYGRGGALESVVGADCSDDIHSDSTTGVFFREQTVDAVVAALQLFEREEHRFDADVIRANASRFSPQVFCASMAKFIANCREAHEIGAATQRRNHAVPVSV